MYDAADRRFMAVDPVKDGLNWYTYCINKPLEYIDPWGLIKKADKLLTEADKNTTGSSSKKTATAPAPVNQQAPSSAPVPMEYDLLNVDPRTFDERFCAPPNPLPTEYELLNVDPRTFDVRYSTPSLLMEYDLLNVDPRTFDVRYSTPPKPLPMTYDSLSVDPRTLEYDEKIVCTSVYYSIEIYGNNQINPAPQPPSGWSRFWRQVGDVLKTAAYEIGSIGLGAIHGFVDTFTFGLLPNPNLPPHNELLYQIGKIVGNLGGAYYGYILFEAGAAVGLVLLPTGVGAAAGAAVSAYGGTVVISGAAQAVGNIVELGYILQATSASGGGGSGDSSGGSESTPQNVYNSIKNSPNYPDGFEPVQNGTKKVNVNNQQLLDQLRTVESGEWKKVYQNGYSNGEQVSIHYFQHTGTGKVFDVKVISGWSTW